MKNTNNIITRSLSVFTRDSLLASFLFFLVLSSWYILRPVRNEMAVANVNELPLLLAFGALAMLLVNPIYAWVASKSNLKKIITYCYSFLISNLLIFLFSWRVLDLGDSIWLGRVFYIWCNIYSFFVVSIFWVLIINIYRDAKSRSFYGVIMAGGSLGALFGSEISKRFASSFDEFGLELFCLSATILLFLAMMTGRYLTSKAVVNQRNEKVGGSGLDGIKNVIQVSEIRSIAIYVWIWTGLMTVHWMTAITIIDGWSQNPEERIVFFSLLEQIVTPLTLIMQLFLTNLSIKYFGIKKILMAYGFLFIVVFMLYGFMPSITIVAVATVTLRLFEYGLNKPTRETVYSTLAKNDRYKSSVFIDTFVTRFGDLSGSSFIGLGKLASISFSAMPLIAIPMAGILSLAGLKIANNKRLKDF